MFNLGAILFKFFNTVASIDLLKSSVNFSDFDYFQSHSGGGTIRLEHALFEFVFKQIERLVTHFLPLQKKLKNQWQCWHLLDVQSEIFETVVITLVKPLYCHNLANVWTFILGSLTLAHFWRSQEVWMGVSW